MTDRELDQLLYQGANQFPPEGGQQNEPPTPWRRALLLICWGIALTTITLNFLNLQYILPAVGSVLLCLGFRSLRRENGWFRQGCVLSILLALYRGATDILLATPLAVTLSDGWGYLLGLVGWLANLWLLFALWRGLKAVFRQAELEARTGAAGGLVICYLLMFFLALVNASGWLLLLPMLILWVCLLAGLFKISRSLDQAGYAITPAPVRLSNGRVLAVSLGALLLAVLSCLLIFSRYPVEASPAQMETGQEELRQELLDLGFPEEVLADLTDEEVALLEGAEAVMVKSDLSRWDTRHDIDHISTHFIQVELPEDMARYFVWFSWDEGPSRRLRESLEVIPDWTQEAILPPDDLQGRLLWEADGQLYQSPLSGVYGSQTQNSIFFGASSHQSFSLDFSLPRRGEHVRGYVTYESRMQVPELIFNYNAEVRYVHQEHWLSYPWESPIQHQWKSWNNNDEAFPARQFLVMFTLNEVLLYA